MGMLEQFRSDYDGQRGTPRYDQVSYGNKDDLSRRHNAETLMSDFQTLAARVDILIKIQERLRKLFKRDIILDWNAGRLTVEFARLDGLSKPYPSSREASGLMHLVGILSALYDDEVGALLIDEPEVSLHPQLQAFLLKEMLAVADLPSANGCKKLVLIATHSTEMVQISIPEDLSSLVFCYDLNSDPIQISPDAGELRNKKIQGLIGRLGQEHKLSLFSKRPLLLEGLSDLIISTALAHKIDSHLEAAGSQVLPVIGKGQMPVVAKLFRLLGKTPVILADADGIADGLDLVDFILSGNSSADKKASKHGASSAQQLAKLIYSDFCQLVQRHWPEVSVHAEVHAYWINRDMADHTDLPKRRAAFCTLFRLEDGVLDKLVPHGEWSSIKNRFSMLLDLLEGEGCFILRLGTIESYYQKSDRLATIGKPSAAVDEVECIGQLSREDILKAYDDVIRCIKSAAASQRISEAEAVRDILLAATAPALAHLDSAKIHTEDDETQNEVINQKVQTLARTILGDRAQLFHFEVTGDSLVVSISSNILEIPGLPIVLKKGDDVIAKVNSALQQEI